MVTSTTGIASHNEGHVSIKGLAVFTTYKLTIQAS